MLTHSHNATSQPIVVPHTNEDSTSKAIQVAAPVEVTDADLIAAGVADHLIDIVVFSLDDQLFGVEIEQVLEVVRPTRITRVPHTADYVRGVMNLRGSIIPVFELHYALGLKPANISDLNRIVVANLEQEPVGLLVDQVHEIMHISQTVIEITSDQVPTLAKRPVHGLVRFSPEYGLVYAKKYLELLDLKVWLQANDPSLVSLRSNVS